MSNTHSDVLILGGGVIGLASALMLLRAGRSVVLIDKGRAGGGSSHGNCGTITPSHLPLQAPGTVAKGLAWLFKPDAPLRIRPRLDPALLRWLLRLAANCNERDYLRVARIKAPLLLASQARLRELVRTEKLDCEFADSGTLYGYRSVPALEPSPAPARLLRELGVPVETLDGEAARRLEPALNASVVGAHHNTGDSRLRPDRYVAELARVVRAAGGRIIEHCALQGFERAGGAVAAAITAQGRMTAGTYVFALGAWAPLIARQIGLDLPIQPGKGYSITYPRPQHAPKIPLVLKERAVCVTAWDSGYRLGSTMEFAGYDDRLNPVRLAALERGAREYLTEPTGPSVEEKWYGWRPMTPDDLPIIGWAPGAANLFLATGHGMLGVSLSAITAQVVTEVVTGRKASVELAPLAPDRFQ